MTRIILSGALITCAACVALLGVALLSAPFRDYRGHELAYLAYDELAGRWRIYRHDISADLAMPLNGPEISPETLAWAPDGQGFVFSAGSSGRALYAVGLGGQGLQRLPGRGERDQFPVPAPDGQRIAFLSSADLSPIPDASVFVSGPEDGPPRRLRFDGRVHGLAWSPDGERLILHGDGPDGGGLYLYDLSSDAISHIAGMPSGAGFPHWSHDGEHLVFTAALDGAQRAVFSLRLDRYELRQLTDGTRAASVPRWSPDDRRISYLTTDTSGRAQVMVMWSDGSGERALNTEQAGQHVLLPTWRP